MGGCGADAAVSTFELYRVSAHSRYIASLIYARVRWKGAAARGSRGPLSHRGPERHSRPNMRARVSLRAAEVPPEARNRIPPLRVVISPCASHDGVNERTCRCSRSPVGRAPRPTLCNAPAIGACSRPPASAQAAAAGAKQGRLRECSASASCVGGAGEYQRSFRRDPRRSTRRDLGAPDGLLCRRLPPLMPLRSEAGVTGWVTVTARGGRRPSARVCVGYGQFPCRRAIANAVTDALGPKVTSYSAMIMTAPVRQRQPQSARSAQSATGWSR